MGRKRRTSVYNILQKKYEVIPFSESWKAAFNLPERTGIWFISGKPTNGKTAFTMQLTYELARIGIKTAYFSYEEGTKIPFQDKMMRFNWADVQKNIVVEDIDDRFIPFSQMEEWFEDNKRVQAVVIDSIQRWDMKKKDIFKLKQMAQKRLIIIVSHVKDNGQPDGPAATEALRDASMKIWIEGFRAISRGRLFGSLGYYTIWPERANKYYANNV